MNGNPLIQTTERSVWSGKLKRMEWEKFRVGPEAHVQYTDERRRKPSAKFNTSSSLLRDWEIYEEVRSDALQELVCVPREHRNDL